MAGKSWFSKGKKGREKSVREDEAAAQRREQSGVWRFRQGSNESAKVVFLDNPDFFIHEHTIKTGPKSFINETCIKDYDNCAPCDDLGDQSSFELIGTVIDTREWKDQKGEKRRNQKKLMVAKGKARQVLLRRIEQNDDDLKYSVFEIARGSQPNECATGEDWVFLKRLTKAQVKKLAPTGEDMDEWLEPMDYEKLFKPKTAEALRKVYGSGESTVGADDDDTGKGKGKEKEKEEETTSGIDEDALQEELEELSRKGLEKYIKNEELDVKFTKRTKDETLIKKIIEAAGEAEENGGGGDDGGGEDNGGDDKDGDIDIDDLI
jgi:hypothetical protein